MFSIFIVVSVLVSAFVAFSPNLQQLMEYDFLRQGRSNSYINFLQRGKLAYRADTLNATNNNTTLDSDLRSDPNTDIRGNITLNTTAPTGPKLEVDMEVIHGQ